MEKKKFRIGELAQYLNIERFVIRFWEKEFCLRPKRSDGGQRFYSAKDVKKFELIKELLYKKKFTIAGAKKYLQEKAARNDNLVKSDMRPAHRIKNPQDYKEFEEIIQQFSTLQKHLIKLRELL